MQSGKNLTHEKTDAALVAFIACAGSAAGKERFVGCKSCSEAVESGFRKGECRNGCVGCGDCVAVCVKGALRRVQGRVVVDRDLCNGCGDCTQDTVCPQGLICLIPADATTFVPCSSKEKRDDVVRSTCTAGCVGCGECERICPTGAIRVVDHHAVIDYSLCVGCRACSTVCTRKIVEDLLHKDTLSKTDVAFVRCAGSEKITVILREQNVTSCREAREIDLRAKGVCSVGCFGLGDCAAGCRYDAITYSDGAAKINADVCVGCGSCMALCPQELISVVPYKAAKQIPCARGMGQECAENNCEKSCLLCGDCAENCPEGAIWLENGRMTIEPELCKNCDVCQIVCRKDLIQELRVPEYITRQRAAFDAKGQPASRAVRRSKFYTPMPEASDAAGRDEMLYVKLIGRLFGTRIRPVLAVDAGAWNGEQELLEEAGTWSRDVLRDPNGFGLDFCRELSERRSSLKNAVTRLESDIAVVAKAWVDNMDDPREAAVIGSVLEKKCSRMPDTNADAALVLENRDLLQKPSVWVFGANASKFADLSEVLKSGQNINLLLFADETAASMVQCAVEARCAYVAKVYYYSDPAQTARALLEADQFDGPAVVFAYVPSEKELELENHVDAVRNTVRKGTWPLMRFAPSGEREADDLYTQHNWWDSEDAAPFASPPSLPGHPCAWEAVNPAKRKESVAERPVEELIQSFRESADGYTEDAAIREAMRCLDCREMPCVKEGCPARNAIPDFIRAVAQGAFEQAYKILEKTTSLPAICSRVCQQATQCEGNCVRGIKGEPVAIGKLERFVADWHRAQMKAAPAVVDETAPRVAVVGAGPAGLTCADCLGKAGYHVTVFEKERAAGGVLTWGIPEFRLPQEIVQDTLDQLEERGVKFEVGQTLGADFTLDSLLNEKAYDAVFLANGAGVPSSMNIPGAALPGVYTADDYLRCVNGKHPGSGQGADILSQAKQVVVVGGGNVAMDVCRCAVRRGAERVSVVYRRTEAEMPADRVELEEAKAEGVEFRFLTNPVKILERDGQVIGVECVRMEPDRIDSSGRRSVKSIPGSEFVLAADQVIMAIGFTFDRVIEESQSVAQSGKGAILTDETGATSRDGVFAGGDTVTGPATVVWAMCAGRQAAYSIQEYIQKKKSE